MLGEVHKLDDRKLSGYADSYYVDKMSKLEIMSMTKEMKLN